MDKDEQLEALKDKVINDRFVALEGRVDDIETERARIVSWAIKAFAAIAIYIFKDPIVHLWSLLK